MEASLGQHKWQSIAAWQPEKSSQVRNKLWKENYATVEANCVGGDSWDKGSPWSLLRINDGLRRDELQ